MPTGSPRSCHLCLACTLKQASFNSSLYANVKSEYRDNKPVLPINVSEPNTNRTYKILDTIISSLEEMEGHTQVSLENARKKRSSKNNVESQSCLVLSISVFPPTINSVPGALRAVLSSVTAAIATSRMKQPTRKASFISCTQIKPTLTTISPMTSIVKLALSPIHLNRR